MQELEFVPDDSDAASLVLRDPGSGRLYRIPVTGVLRDHVTAAQELAAEEAGETGDPTAATGVPGAGAGSPAPGTGATGDPASADSASAPQLTVTAVEHAAEEPRPRVKLRPREIQKRLRHGATVAELVAETGAPESRILPYAHPIDMERRRIAELARQAYPVLSDGPAEHTLWESLATAYAARQEDVRAATWDAAMDSSDDWIVTVTWTRGNRRGATEFVAEFRWVPVAHPGAGPTTVEPVNSVATDLVDPRFNRPVRSVSASVPGEDATGDRGDGPGDNHRDSHRDSLRGDAPEDVPADRDDEDQSIAPAVDLFGESNPDQRSHPAKRRRNSSTPHWEDVLLGVRTSPRKKK